MYVGERSQGFKNEGQLNPTNQEFSTHRLIADPNSSQIRHQMLENASFVLIFE